MSRYNLGLAALLSPQRLRAENAEYKNAWEIYRFSEISLTDLDCTVVEWGHLTCVTKFEEIFFVYVKSFIFLSWKTF